MKRYQLAPGTLAGVEEHPEGSFVHWNDYERLRSGLLAHACMCGPTDPNPLVHREDCPYRKWVHP